MKRLALLFLVLQIAVILISWYRLPPELPLFYSRPWGKEMLTPTIGLFLLPIFSLAVFLINQIIFKFMPKEEKLISQILISISTVFNLLLLITLIQIIRLVI